MSLYPTLEDLPPNQQIQLGSIADFDTLLAKEAESLRKIQKNYLF